MPRHKLLRLVRGLGEEPWNTVAKARERRTRKESTGHSDRGLRGRE